jgi:hypothetical protein
MFGARLPREEHELLGAIAIVVLVNDDFQAFAFETTQTEVGDFDLLALCGSQHDARIGEHFCGARLRFACRHDSDSTNSLAARTRIDAHPRSIGVSRRGKNRYDIAGP